MAHVAAATAQLPMPMVGLTPPATEGNRPGNSPATTCKSTSAAFRLVEAVDIAAARCGYTDKDLARFMGISGGTWSKQKNGVENCHIQLDKLALLPEDWQREFVAVHAALVGSTIAHQSIADLLVARVGQLLVECNALHAQLTALSRRTA